MFNPSNAYLPLRSIAPLTRKTINWASLLTNTQKTLNIVNQAIPIVYQAKPIINNARTMFRIASEFSKTDNTAQHNNINTTSKYNNIQNETSSNNNNQPNFFI